LPVFPSFFRSSLGAGPENFPYSSQASDQLQRLQRPTVPLGRYQLSPTHAPGHSHKSSSQLWSLLAPESRPEGSPQIAATGTARNFGFLPGRNPCTRQGQSNLPRNE